MLENEKDRTKVDRGSSKSKLDVRKEKNKEAGTEEEIRRKKLYIKPENQMKKNEGEIPVRNHNGPSRITVGGFGVRVDERIG